MEGEKLQIGDVPPSSRFSDKKDGMFVDLPSVKSFSTAVLVCREHHVRAVPAMYHGTWISMALTRHARPIIDTRDR